MVIKKNNALTDGNLPDSQVLTEKTANVLYYNYEQSGSKFEIEISNLLKQLELTNNGRNKQRLKDSLSVLMQPIEVRNFNYKGHDVKWLLSSFLQKARISKDNQKIMQFELDDELLVALKQCSTFTEIEIETSNKFKTKYGITLWQMYLRYKKQIRQGSEQTGLTYQHKSLQELNKKFGTNFKYVSDMERGIKRGLAEIKKITDKNLVVKYDKKVKKFCFLWKIEKDTKTNFKHFREWVQDNFTNELLTYTEHTDNRKGITTKVRLGVDNNGYIVDLDGLVAFDETQAREIWKYLFDNQDSIIAFKQQTLF